MDPVKIFIVEDDNVILNALEKFLRNWSYDVYFPDDFSSIYEKFLEVKPDLVLLDVSLPFFNGYYWCEQIRKSSNVPIIFISSADENLRCFHILGIVNRLLFWVVGLLDHMVVLLIF